MIYTSRYANPELIGNKYYTVAISSGLPKFPLKYLIDAQERLFAPDHWMWNKSREDFGRLYKEKISRYGKSFVRDKINGLVKAAGERDVVLLCFEDVRVSDQYCHRTNLAEWLNEKLGMSVTELHDPTVPKEKKPVQEEPEFEQISFDQLL